jgi:hypothetical protein
MPDVYHTEKKNVKICNHYQINCSFQRLGTFKKQLQMQLLGSSCLYAHPSARPSACNNLTPTGWTFTEPSIQDLCKTSSTY